jgi:hypothetical protein
MLGNITELLKTWYGDINTDGVYKPKPVGRRSNHYKRYFKAMTPPKGHWILGPSSKWSNKKEALKVPLLRVENGNVFIRYIPRTL